MVGLRKSPRRIACSPSAFLARPFSLPVVAIAPWSPSWHRNQRRLRAKIRKRIWTARCSGSSASSKDLLRIAAHHTRPNYRELRHISMSETWRGSGGWGYWQGAPWRQKGNKQNGKQGKGSDGKEQPSLPTFPAYDNKKGGTAVVQLTQTSEHIHIVQTQRRDDTMVKDLQRTLNLARKAKNKVMKITCRSARGCGPNGNAS